MMPTLHVHLLGDFHLMLDAKSITSVIPPRVQLLLAYVALHCRTPQSRQRLAFLFWPDSSEDQARNNLRQSLHLLKQTLPHSERFLQLDAQAIQWLPDSPFTLDVADFEKAVEQADSIDSLRQAVSLYRGDLLAGCYDEWILSERERLRQQFIEALERLVVSLENRRDYHSAIRYAEYLLRSDPLREETYRQLIRLHGLSGNRADARRVYRTCVTVLKSELDVEPSAETRAMNDQVQKIETAPLPAEGPFPRRTTDNLPKYLTGFVGRNEELENLKRLISSSQGKSGTRLITLTGTGGCGKTRLAIQLAGELRDTFADGVWFIDLAPLTDPALIPHSIASLLGVQSQSDRALIDTLADDLQSKMLLLIFDNCEHLVSPCAQIVESLLRACPSLQVVATTRERLNVMGEVVWRVPSLSLPDPNDLTLSTLSHSDAIRLFVDRACAALPTFTLNALNAPSVIQICQRLDGIPLAIELAAARIAMLTPTQIAGRLDHAFQLLTQGGSSTLSRHQTLRATMDWSYALLSEKEQVLFRRLAVFADGFTLEAVETVCAQKEQDRLVTGEVLDLLSKLADKSLVNVTDSEQGDQARYRLLEPMWQYANEKLLESGDWEPLGSRHLDFFSKLAEEAEPHFSHTEQAVWFNRLIAEHANLMVALDWSLKHGELTAALRLTGALWYFWLARGYYTAGSTRLMQAISLTKTAALSSARAKALWAAGAICLWSQGDGVHARPLLEEAVTSSRELGDKKILAGALGTLGAAATSQGDYSAGRIFLTESLTLLRDLDDLHATGWSLTYLGDLLLAQHDVEQAQKLYGEAVENFRAIGDVNSMGYPIRRLGITALDQGDVQQAGTWIEASLTLNRQVGYLQGIAASMAAQAELALRRGQPVRAARLLGAAEAQLNAVAGKLFPTDQTEYNLTANALRAQLEEASLHCALAEGRAMNLEQAIDQAMDTDPP